MATDFHPSIQFVELVSTRSSSRGPICVQTRCAFDQWLQSVSQAKQAIN